MGAKKWKNGVAECYSGPPSCDYPEADELAILVTGGGGGVFGVSTSAEVLFTNGSSICELPVMPRAKMYHTQSGLNACGGSRGDIDNRRNCIKFEDGSWTTLTDNLVEKRDEHSSWVNPDGDILLIGGLYSSTTEIVYQNGTSIRSFDLKYHTSRFACSIELPEMFILTGGRNALTKVSQYTTSGWMEDLPELNEGRYWHGCGYFYNDDMQRVFLVAGGMYHDWVGTELSSTETLVEGGQAWNFQQPLPFFRYAFQGISLPNTVIMIGGYPDVDGDGHWHTSNDVLMFDPKTPDWKKVGSLKKARDDHAASLVKMGDVIDYCN